MGPTALSPRAPQIWDTLRGEGMSPSGKACPSPVPGTCWEHWDGLQREGKGGEGWEKGKGPSREQGRAAVMAARMEGGKKKKK